MTNKSGEVPVKTGDADPAATRQAMRPLSSLRERIDYLFDEFHDGWPFGRMQHRAAHSIGVPFDWVFQSPSVDFVDREKDIQLKAELPGMDEKDIEVQLTDRMLTISGEKKEEREEGEEEGNYYLSERRYGSFKRSLSIPEGVDPDKVEASFNKGVLTVTLPKTPEAQNKTKKIEVKRKD